MRILNIIIIFVLILMTVYMFHADSINKGHINSLKHELKVHNRLIDSLHTGNELILNDVGVLKDSIVRYKTSIIIYEDSLIKIRNHYENISSDVYVLNDSASYEYFKKYLSNYATKHSRGAN